jgi:hypothetical protein
MFKHCNRRYATKLSGCWDERLLVIVLVENLFGENFGSLILGID